MFLHNRRSNLVPVSYLFNKRAAVVVVACTKKMENIAAPMTMAELKTDPGDLLLIASDEFVAFRMILKPPFKWLDMCTKDPWDATPIERTIFYRNKDDETLLFHRHPSEEQSRKALLIALRASYDFGTTQFYSNSMPAFFEAWQVKIMVLSLLDAMIRE